MSGTTDYEVRFSGIARLYGRAGLSRIERAHVCVVGVGGVGSWTAEALARSGIGALTLIDLDEVCLSNVNRQLPALTSEVGKAKVQVLRERIAGINPECAVHAIEEFFTLTSAERLLATPYDYVVDAIDSVANKCLLLARCHQKDIPVITLAGAGGRRDPTALKIADLAFSGHDRLLRAVRKMLRAEYGFPASANTPFGVPSVFSTEPPVFPQPDGTVCAQRRDAEDLRMNCNSGFGSATFVTGAFGFAAAAHVLREVSAHPIGENIAQPDSHQAKCEA
jgi:tRNA threonylcarbamoyladenosine dehydratase